MRGTTTMTKQENVKSGSKSKKRLLFHEHDDEWRPTGLETSSSSDFYEDDSIERRRKKKAKRALQN